MTLVKNPVKGMKDILPNEMLIRNYCLTEIRNAYGAFGYTEIETPCVENISLLCSNQGGENEKLIFKILKRGEKLSLENILNENDLVDSGLRYDLTVPLARYFSANRDKLPYPFKSLQIGSVWRADRPQRGRFRQFTQCDIDILGDNSYMAEIDLILATSSLLVKLGFKNITVKINDRKILKALYEYSNFEEDKFDIFCIILDKLDKIGIDGVKKELNEIFNFENVEKCLSLIEKVSNSDNKLQCLVENIESLAREEYINNLNDISSIVSRVKEEGVNIEFDITLVRGMGYYTGSIFEIQTKEFNGAIAGGGRYDNMIGKFTSTNVPACGFSIGFERIITLLLENNTTLNSNAKKMAFLVENNMNNESLQNIFKEAKELRLKGYIVLVTTRNKNVKFQKDNLLQQGYNEFKDFYNNNK